MRRVLAFTFALALVVGVSVVEAFNPQLVEYTKVVDGICVTGITPDVKAKFEALDAALDDENYGKGRDSNFWGASTPELVYDQKCLPSGGGA